MLKHLRFDIFELQEMKLPVRLISTTNEWRLRTRGLETIPLRVKGDIEGVSNELDNGGLKLHFLDETPKILLTRRVRHPKKPVQGL
ncbi:uncharacterized protein TNCV_170301 [Trichonephila clavipes]|nr:uncharacterized protein TNCV_170301 [Trichonephila clavipes]